MMTNPVCYFITVFCRNLYLVDFSVLNVIYSYCVQQMFCLFCILIINKGSVCFTVCAFDTQHHYLCIAEAIMCIFRSETAYYIWAATWQNQQSECAPSEDTDQAGHPPSLIRVFTVRMKKACVLGYPLSTQHRLWSDWADAHTDLSLRWAHIHFVGFVMSGLMCIFRSKTAYYIC